MNGDVLTTGDAVALSGLSRQTIIRAMDRGELRGYKIPGPGGHRRMLAKELAAFLAKNGVPLLPELERLCGTSTCSGVPTAAYTPERPAD